MIANELEGKNKTRINQQNHIMLRVMIQLHLGMKIVKQNTLTTTMKIDKTNSYLIDIIQILYII